MAGGRVSDDAVNWYCHVRVVALVDSGVQQKSIAEQTGIAESAIAGIKKSANGVGPATAAKLAGLFGFSSRGALIDAADEWWQREGKIYSLQHANKQLREMRAKLGVDEKLSATAPSGIGRARGAMDGKAQKLLKGSHGRRKRRASE